MSLKTLGHFQGSLEKSHSIPAVSVCVCVGGHAERRRQGTMMTRLKTSITKLINAQKLEIMTKEFKHLRKK